MIRTPGAVRRKGAGPGESITLTPAPNRDLHGTRIGGGISRHRIERAAPEEDDATATTRKKAPLSSEVSGALTFGGLRQTAIVEPSLKFESWRNNSENIAGAQPASGR